MKNCIEYCGGCCWWYVDLTVILLCCTDVYCAILMISLFTYHSVDSLIGYETSTYLDPYCITAIYLTAHSRTCPIPLCRYHFNPCNKRMSLRLFPSIQWDSGRFIILLQWCGPAKDRRPSTNSDERVGEGFYGNKITAGEDPLKICGWEISTFPFQKNSWERIYFKLWRTFLTTPDISNSHENANDRVLKFTVSQVWTSQITEVLSTCVIRVYVKSFGTREKVEDFVASHIIIFSLLDLSRYDQWLNIKWSVSSKELCCVY